MRKSWKDLSVRQKRAVRLAVLMQVVLASAALRDIARRPRDQIRGSKGWWSLACLVNSAGPVAYFIFGRKRNRP